MKELYKALANVQQNAPNIAKNKSGYGYKYADLSNIFVHVKPLLKENGLGFWQGVNGTTLKTVIFHIETGQEIETNLDIPQDISLKGQNGFQVLGSAITYFKRYQISAMLGIVTDEDTDAQTPTQQPKAKATPKPENIVKAGEKLFDEFAELVKGAPESKHKEQAEAIVKAGKATKPQLEKWITWLKTQKK